MATPLIDAALMDEGAGPLLEKIAMLGRRSFLIVVVALVALLAGCTTTSVSPVPQMPVPPELQAFPRDADTTPTPDNIQRQLDLAKRNLYQTRDGHVRLASVQACELDLVAHRGHVDYPENSISGIKAAFAAGFPKVEIDIMRLRDGTWVLHHDPVTGRTSGFTSGSNAAISMMTAKDFSKLRVRDTKTLQLTSEPAPTLAALLKALAPVMADNQRLQVEFKSGASAHELATIDQLLAKALGQRFEYVAQDVQLLMQLRQLNSWVYLGIIEVPASASMQAQARQQAAARGITSTRLSHIVEQKAQAAYRNSRTNWLTPAGMANVQQHLGRNAGIHVDHAALTQQQTAVARANKLNIPLYTYTITGHAPHMAALTRLQQQGAMPVGAIVDDTHLNVCSAFFNVIPAAIASGSQESFILRLPADADFAVLDEQQRLLAMGQYRKTTGEIARLSTRHTAATNPQPVLLNVDFKTVQDESIDLRREGALRIYLHQGPIHDKTSP